MLVSEISNPQWRELDTAVQKTPIIARVFTDHLQQERSLMRDTYSDLLLTSLLKSCLDKCGCDIFGVSAILLPFEDFLMQQHRWLRRNVLLPVPVTTNERRALNVDLLIKAWRCFFAFVFFEFPCFVHLFRGVCLP